MQLMDGRGCAVGNGIALSQETVLSVTNAPYPVESAQPQSWSRRGQSDGSVGRSESANLRRIEDEETESSLDADSGSVAFIPTVLTQDSSQPTQSVGQGDTSSGSASQNIKAYADLLRSDVRQQKAEMVGEVMQLSAADAAKFWPIYNEYDAQLNKLNDLRVANIQEYANSYDQMTDEKEDELIQKALAFRKQRSELLVTYYERVIKELGGITAARFIQVEDQLLLIIDLQIDSALPVVGQSS